MTSTRKNNYSVATHNRFEQLATDDEGDTHSKVSLKTRAVNKADKVETEKKVDTAMPMKPRRPTRSLRQKPEEKPTPLQTNNGNYQVLSGSEDPEKPKIRYKPRAAGSREALTSGSLRSSQRMFDRHSGTGRGKEMKRRGAGSHNWGNEIIENNNLASTQNENDEPDLETNEQQQKDNQSVTDYAQYKRSIEAKRENLLLNDRPQQINVKEQRSLNSHEFDDDNFQKYEKNQSSIEVSRSDRYKAEHNENEEVSGRQRVNKLNEFTNKLGSDVNGRFGRGRGRGRRVFRNGRKSVEEVAPSREPVERLFVMDLSDAAAFPTLA